MSDKVEVDADGYETLYRKYHLALRLLREERERSERLRDAVRWAYEGGHNDTVDGQYGDPEEVADEIVAELDDEASK